MAAVKGVILILLLILSPLSLGMLSRQLLKGERDLPASWAEGMLLQTAVFSGILHLTILFSGGGDPTADVILPFMAACTVSVAAAVILFAAEFIKNRNLPIWSRGPVKRVYAMAAVILIFALASALMKAPGETVMSDYVAAYTGGTDPGMGLARYYLCMNRLISMSPDRFLKYIIGLSALLAMALCLEELGRSLKLRGRSREIFMPLVMGLYLITFFSSEYRDFGIYTRLWDPVTMYMTLFCPLQFMMMLKISDGIAEGITERPAESIRLFILTAAVLLAGLLMPGNIMLLSVPEILGVLTGTVRRIRRVRDTVIYTE